LPWNRWLLRAFGDQRARSGWTRCERSIVGATAWIIGPTVPYSRNFHPWLKHNANRALVLTRQQLVDEGPIVGGAIKYFHRAGARLVGVKLLDYQLIITHPLLIKSNNHVLAFPHRPLEAASADHGLCMRLAAVVVQAQRGVREALPQRRLVPRMDVADLVPARAVEAPRGVPAEARLGPQATLGPRITYWKRRGGGRAAVPFINTRIRWSGTVAPSLGQATDARHWVAGGRLARGRAHTPRS
jgi:hypothetical protein